MKKSKSINSRQGFTIIEVVLVLAIAGLIFLMVFIALPALQRSQRDTQRRTDFSRLFSSLQNYMNNNKGALPTVTGTSAKVGAVTGNETASSVTGTPSATTNGWINFYKNYMLASGDTFVDPAGTAYSLRIATCSNSATNFSAPNTGLTAGNNCTVSNIQPIGETSGQAIGLTGGTYASELTFERQKATIVVIIGASCNGEKAIAATTKTGGTRKFAIMYRMESGGVFCQSN